MSAPYHSPLVSLASCTSNSTHNPTSDPLTGSVMAYYWRFLLSHPVGALLACTLPAYALGSRAPAPPSVTVLPAVYAGPPAVHSDTQFELSAAISPARPCVCAGASRAGQALKPASALGTVQHSLNSVSAATGRLAAVADLFRGVWDLGLSRLGLEHLVRGRHGASDQHSLPRSAGTDQVGAAGRVTL